MVSIQQLSAGPKTHQGQFETLPQVLLVLDGFPKTLGGGERIVLRLAELLPRFGYRASILTFRLDPEGEFQPRNSPCPLYLLPLSNTYGLQAFAGAFAFRRFLKQHKIQIVETFFESSDIWAGFVTYFFSKAALVWSRRDMGILRSAKHRWAYRALRHCPDAVIAVSRRVAEHVVEQDGVPAKRVYVVHNGLDLNALDPVPPRMWTAQTTCCITTIGNIRKVKGHDILLQAVQQVRTRFPNVRLTIAGEVLEPDFFDELKRQVSSEHLDASVQFLGKVDDLATHLSHSDIFVLPSRSEGFSNALIEAMAMGLPVIATDVGGNGEAIIDGQNGLLVQPDDPGVLAQALIQLLEEPRFAHALGRSARESVQQQFTADAMMHSVTRIFACALQTKAT